MSSKNLEKVIQRAISDAAFRRQIQSNPEGALRGFKLTDDEVAALRSGDAGKLMSLGIDQRMSKTFTVGGEAFASRAASSGDLSSVGGAAIADQGVTRLANDLTGNAAGGSAAIDPGAESGATSAEATGGYGTSYPAHDGLAGVSGAVNAMASESTYRVRDVEPVAIGDPIPNADNSADALEDKSHAFAATRSADVEGSTRSAVRDLNTPDTTATSDGTSAPSSDALEDQSHAFAAGRTADVEGTVSSAVRDIEPGALGGSGLVAPVEGSPESFAFQDNAAAPSADALEDQSHAFAASRTADMEGTVRSAIRDLDTPDTTAASVDPMDEGAIRSPYQDLGVTGAATGRVAPVEGSPEETAFSNAGDTVRSAVRDVEPADVGSSGTFSGDDAAGPGYLLGSDAEGNTISRIRDVEPADLGSSTTSDDAAGADRVLISDAEGETISRVRDVEPVDLSGSTSAASGGTTAPTDMEAAEAYAPSFHTSSDAFLSEGEASQYSSDPNWSSDMAEDTAHAFNPGDASDAVAGGTDSTDGTDEQISS